MRRGEAGCLASAHIVNRQLTLVSPPLAQRINNLYDDIWSTTNAVQETWRFVVIIVLFVLAILFTLGLMGLVSRMRFPKTTSLVTSFYWLMVALLMLGGTGTREKEGG